jgi:hypothetical protein
MLDLNKERARIIVRTRLVGMDPCEIGTLPAIRHLGEQKLKAGDLAKLLQEHLIPVRDIAWIIHLSGAGEPGVRLGLKAIEIPNYEISHYLAELKDPQKYKLEKPKAIIPQPFFTPPEKTQTNAPEYYSRLRKK